MDEGHRRALWNAWVGWARGEFPEDEATALGAAAQALAVVESGRNSAEAVAAAKTWAASQWAQRVSPGAIDQSGDAAHLEWVIADLEAARTTATFTAEARTLLLKRYRKRLDAIAAAAPAATANAAAGTAPTAAGTLAASPVGPSSSAPPGPPSAAELAAAPVMPWPTAPKVPSADAGVLILSYIGAFMLIVATLLFEIYGLSGFGGGTKFAVVLALNVFFGVAGYYCYRSKRLHIVGETYVAIFALMAPLVFVAAYEFLALREQGIEPSREPRAP
jgi:hypothetical protein